MKLLGGNPHELRVSAEALLDIVGILLDGARQAARFVVEGESTRKGPRPSWLGEISKFEITGLSHGSAIVAIEAPTFAEAAPERFGTGRQVILFPEPAQILDVEQSAFDVFGRVMAAALKNDRENLLADRTLLDTCARFAHAAGQTYDGIELTGLANHTGPLRIQSSDVQRIKDLRDETPAPKIVRISGILDTISASRSAIVMTLANGESVAARLEQHDPSALKDHFGKKVVASGTAHFRPSGRLIAIDVDYLSDASEHDMIWETLPTTLPTRNEPVANLLYQDQSSGVAALFGKWPGTESDEELLDALEALG